MRMRMRTRRRMLMMEITDLVPATMKTKVVRVAMPSTNRIWFLSPPSSPKLESSLFSRSSSVLVFPFPQIPSHDLTYPPICHESFEHLSRISLLKNSCPIFW